MASPVVQLQPSCRALLATIEPLGEAALSLSSLEKLRAEFFAEDLDIPAGAAGIWTRTQASLYFETGGVRVPPTAQPFRSLKDLCTAVGVSTVATRLLDESKCSGRDCVDRLRHSRQALLRHLAVVGIKSLSERQLLVNELSKAWRQILPLLHLYLHPIFKFDTQLEGATAAVPHLRYLTGE